MKKCFHAYELGFLSESEKEKLELHMMDCEHCFQQVQQLQKAADLLRNDSEVRGTYTGMSEKSEETASPKTLPAHIHKRKYWPTLVPDIDSCNYCLFLPYPQRLGYPDTAFS